jgi:hypothetical protein
MLRSSGSRHVGRRSPGIVACAALLACSEPGAPGAAGDAEVVETGAPPPALDVAGSRADASTGAAGLELDAASAPSPVEDAASPPLDAAPEPLDAGAPSTQVRSLLALPERWVPLDAAADPFDDRPALVHCLPEAVMAETLSAERVLGVDTGFCDYVTVTQPTLRAAAAGELLKVRLWHFELSAPEPAEAHAVLSVDGLRVLDERIAIPQPGGLISRQRVLERAVPAGAPVYFHLHNHGANSWALVELSAGP